MVDGTLIFNSWFKHEDSPWCVMTFGKSKIQHKNTNYISWDSILVYITLWTRNFLLAHGQYVHQDCYRTMHTIENFLLAYGQYVHQDNYRNVNPIENVHEK